MHERGFGLAKSGVQWPTRPAFFMSEKGRNSLAKVYGGPIAMNLAGSAKVRIPTGRVALRTATYLLEFLIVAVTYFGLTVSLYLVPTINAVATPLWPPTGFALALVLLRGDRIVPALLAGYGAFH